MLQINLFMDLSICRKRELIKGIKSVFRMERAFMDLPNECYVSFCMY